MNRGKPNWEHLQEELHVLIMVEDTKNRAEVKLQRAIEEVKKLLVPAVSITNSVFLRLLIVVMAMWEVAKLGVVIQQINTENLAYFKENLRHMSWISMEQMFGLSSL